MNIVCVAKIYTSILNKRLQHFLEKNNLLSDAQNGFRMGRSCIDHIFVMCTILRNRKALGKETFLCFVDFKKAFDRVWHDGLWHTLRSYNFEKGLIQTIQALYEEATSAVLLNNKVGEPLRTSVEVRQGCLLSPTHGQRLP